MSALLRKKKRWEFEQERKLQLVLDETAQIGRTSLEKLVCLINIALFVLYKLLVLSSAVLRLLFVKPQLVIQKSPTEFENIES